MKYGMLVGISLLAITLAAQAMVTVTGCAFLSGQPYHDGIHVVFEAVSPSAETDSVPTNSGGEFMADLQPGVYHVIYRYAGFATYRRANVALLFDTALDTVMLYPGLSGALSGTLNAGTYQVTNSIWVNTLQTLTMEPGTTLLFEPGVRFVVRGTLNALGHEGDSIVFTARYPSRDSLWAGLRFRGPGGPGGVGSLTYCVVEKSCATDGAEYDYTSGGGLLCDRGHLDLSHCRVHQNIVRNWGGAGGGIAFYHATGSLTDCVISDNTSEFGGGVYLRWSTVILTRCTIEADSASYGGGIYCDGGNVTVNDSHISRNRMAGRGCGIYCADSTNLDIANSAIVNNEGDVSGGGFYSTDSSPVLTGCLIANNIGVAGIECAGGAPVFNRCTISGCHSGEWAYDADNIYLNGTTATFNSCLIVNAHGGMGVRFVRSENSRIIYSDIFGNGGGRFADINEGPVAIGVIALTNANGDSCDTYYNVYRDPLFVDTASGDYHLTENSPCIDAGDPALANDPDGTIADIGAYYYPQETGAGSTPTALPAAFTLAQNYPNPFNAETRIEYELAQAGTTVLTLYDVTGRTVRTLLNGTQSAGRHAIRMTGEDLSSGVYFYTLRAGADTQTRKMVLLK
jgi:hypothetical protein